jgi:hypothetical protein
VREASDTIAVRLAIEHKQSSGFCGCKSASLKVLVFAEGEGALPKGAAPGQKRLVQTSPAFANTLPSHDLNIKERRAELPQNYKIWLACTRCTTNVDRKHRANRNLT